MAILPEDFDILDVDWEEQRKILPERYILRLDDNLLDRHSYGPDFKVKPRSPEHYELTKANVKRALPLFAGIPLQIEHGVDGSEDPKTGFVNVYQNKSVVGTVVKAWINPEKDHELLCEVKFDNSKNSSLLWNYALHHTKANRGASLCPSSNYYGMIPLEVSLVEKGMKPNTGVISVIDKDEKIINFKEYKLQHEKTPDTTTPPSPTAVAPVDPTTEKEVPVITTEEPIAPSSSSSSPPASPSIPAEMQVAPASGAMQPRDPVTKKFISHAEAQARGIEPIPFTPAPTQTQQAPPTQQMQQQQQSTTIVDPAAQYATPGTFTTPMPPNPALQSATKEYPMNTNFNGMLHTSMMGTPLEGIAMQEHARYQREAAERAQLQQQQGGFQNQQQFMQSVANGSGGFIQPPPPTQAVPQQQQQQQQQLQAQDSKMEDVEESQEEVDNWFDKATPEEKEKEHKSAEQKIMSGRIKELTKREALVHADRLLQREKERNDSANKLLESNKEQKALMQTFISALSALKPDSQQQQPENLSQAVTQYVAAASSRVSSLETQNQMYQQWMNEQNKRQKQEQSLPRHLQRIANQYADLSSSSHSSTASLASGMSAYSTTPYQQSPPPLMNQQQQLQPTYSVAPASAHMAQAPPPLAPQRPYMGIQQQKALLRDIMSGRDPSPSYYEDTYVPTSTPPHLQQQQMQIAPASHRSGQKRTHESNQAPASSQQQDAYYPPDKNTVVDNDWLNHPVYYKSFTPALRESFQRAGKYDAWNGYEQSYLYMIAPDFVQKCREQQASRQMIME